MNRHVPDVVRLAERIASRHGEACGGLRLIADRRGSRVYCLEFPAGDVALKLATRNADNQGVHEAEHLARREAAVLLHLPEFTPGYLIDSGDLDGDGSWLALRWLDGITPHRLSAPARHGDDSLARRDNLVHTAADIADRLAALHALGWRHADLPPAHILLDSGTIGLIDFALAQGPHALHTDDVPYRGGMVHFTAPETAAHILATPNNQPIPLNERAEVYALAAVLSRLDWPTAYQLHPRPSAVAGQTQRHSSRAPTRFCSYKTLVMACIRERLAPCAYARTRGQNAQHG